MEEPTIMDLFHEWMLTHAVFTSPRMMDIMGGEVVEYHHHPEMQEGFKW